MPPYTNLIFDNQLQKLHLPPKNYNEKCSTMVFGRKVSQGSCFKKDSHLNSNFSIAM